MIKCLKDIPLGRIPEKDLADFIKMIFAEIERRGRPATGQTQ